jgi:hypothetical protein
MQLTGKCHCGNIALSVDWEGDPPEIPARACGCSFCVKHGGVWTSNPRGAVSVAIADRACTTTYSFGTRTAVFHICTRCGTVPIVTSDIDGHTYAVVNVNALEDVDPAWLRRGAVSFEGEDLEARLARRARNWIPRVRFVDAGAAPQ